MADGVDLSNNNGGAFPDAADFAFLKATEGANFDDKNFEGYVEECKRRNIPWGSYHFPHPDVNSPKAEADYFLARTQAGPLGWALDVETRTSGGKTISPMAIMGAQALADWSEEFRSLVEPALGRSWFYTFRDYAKHLFPLISHDWLIWLATATNSPSFPQYEGRTVAIEQYGQDGGFDRNFAHLPITGDDEDMFTDNDRAMLNRLHERVGAIDDIHAEVSIEPDLRTTLTLILAKSEVSAKAIAEAIPDAIVQDVADEIARRIQTKT